MTIGASIAEPLQVHEPALNKLQREAKVREILPRVGLDPNLINRYPHELSGGQNQRVGIARAMILQPKLVICDEAVSALDVSVQAQVVDLLIELQKEFGLAMIFISHDLAVVRQISHRVMVLYLGRVVELAGRSLVDMERELIRVNLELCGKNRERTAKILGIGERTLYRKIKEYGLE
jgi:ABC-type glutathione transport system ATPase component